MQQDTATTPEPEADVEQAAAPETEPTPKPLTVQALLFRVKRVANGAPPTFAFTVNGGTRIAETNPAAAGVGGRVWSEMDKMDDVVMMPKAAFLALLEALQTEDGPDVHVDGCSGYLMTTEKSPFGVENVGKKVTFG